MDQHSAAVPQSDELAAIRARVWEVCARTGTTEQQLAEVIGVDRAKIAASFACDRRFSTYELAAIAEHGRTTVEWLCGETDEYEYDEPTRSTRWFWWHAHSLTNRWRPLFWGTDENCNRTIGLRLPGGVLFLCLTVPLRQEECDECRSLAQ